MVDFSNANLCGASPEMNDLFTKLEQAADEIEAKLEEAASAAASAFGSLEGETTYLCIDRLCPLEVRPGWGELSVDFRLLGDPSNAAHAEE